MLNMNQVELGNVFFGTNSAGLIVERRLVGGAYGECTKWFLIDSQTMELKSRVRETKEEVLEGFEIEAIVCPELRERGEISKDVNEYEIGDLFYVVLDGELVPRMVVGGTAYDNTVYFAIDPITGKRTSRTKETIEEVLGVYEIEFILKQ